MKFKAKVSFTVEVEADDPYWVENELESIIDKYSVFKDKRVDIKMTEFCLKVKKQSSDVEKVVVLGDILHIDEEDNHEIS